MSQSDTESDSSGPSTKKKIKKTKSWRKQKFNKDWLALDQFKGWLTEIPEDPFSCKCNACDCTLICGKSELLKHSNGKKHLQKVKSVAQNSNITSFFHPVCTRDESRQVQDFELRLSAFFAEHNVAFQVVDHLVPLLKEIIPDSKILQKVSLGRHKCTSIIKNVLAPSVSEDLVNILKFNKFSILIDESTDIGLNKSINNE